MSEGKKEHKNVFIGQNPDTGRKYFEKRKVVPKRPIDPENAPISEEPPELLEEKPGSPMYPTTKPPRQDVPMGGLPKGDQD